MRTARILRVFTLAAAPLAGLSGCAAHSLRPPRLVPLPGASYSLQGEAATIRTGTLRLTIAPLDDAARRAYIRERTPAGSDEFGPGPDGKPRYYTFQLVLENLGEKDPISFQPQGVILAQEGGDRVFPLDFPEAYRLLAGRDNVDPSLLEDLSKYMFDVGVTLSPGERIDRLLIYPAQKVRAKKLRMEFNFLEPLKSSERYDVLLKRETGP